MSFVTVAVTGGPAGGKTTGMKELPKLFGDQVLVMPEVASILLDGGYPNPGRDVVHSPEWVEGFQNAVVPVQLNMEEEYRRMALQRATRVLVCDRGLLDPAAYLGRGVEAYLEMFGFSLEDLHKRYDLVVHLESVAVKRPDLYAKVKHTNNRFESAEEAAAVDLAIQAAWNGHPNRVVVSSASIQEVKNNLCNLVGQFLREEIERKYLLQRMPNIALGEGIPVTQGYMPTEVEMRARRMGDQGYITIKGDASHGGSQRPECERQFDIWAIEAALKSAKSVVEKTRWIIPHGQYRLELDQYHGPLEGLVTVECEFLTQEAMDAFALPDWAIEARAWDVTDDPRYKNIRLAEHGLPV